MLFLCVTNLLVYYQRFVIFGVSKRDRKWYFISSCYIGLIICFFILILDSFNFEEVKVKIKKDFNNNILHINERHSLPKPQQYFCSHQPKTLVGVKTDVSSLSPDIDVISAKDNKVIAGGQWTPDDCMPLRRVAIIIPYRNRWHHLKLLLSVLHPMLQRQKLHYRIVIVEQAYNDVFNKGRIMNIAFESARTSLGQYDCYIFHDVDLLPENDYNIYKCGDNPRHLSPAIDEMRYLLMYKKLAGGVLALNTSQVININGYSNLYWGWGGEDDDMSHRIYDAGYVIERPPMNVGRYKMIRHGKRDRAHNRYKLLDRWKRWPTDGVNSLAKLKYTILSIHEHALYTNITVDIGRMDSAADLEQHVQQVDKTPWSWN